MRCLKSCVNLQTSVLSQVIIYYVEVIPKADDFCRPEESAPKIGIKSFVFSLGFAGSRHPFSCCGVSQGDMNDCFVVELPKSRSLAEFTQSAEIKGFFASLRMTASEGIR